MTPADDVDGATDAAGTAQNADVLLRSARSGDKNALDYLFALAYEELRRVAHRVRRTDDPLTTTALVHEAYLKLMPGGVPANDRAHFRLLIARAMRQLLIDEARNRQTQKRGGGAIQVRLDAIDESDPMTSEALVNLDNALKELERADPRRASVVECRFFGGLDVEETAAALNVSTATVKRDWRIARAWLAQALR